jgi:nitrite reductase/ring-hydroxylating ferredoxin subunit/uncharacterized membrane protein
MTQSRPTQQGDVLHGSDPSHSATTTRPGIAESLVGRLEALPGLDLVDKALSRAAEPLLGAPWAAGLRDFLHGRWVGHALHPVVSDLPIGFWTSSVVTDLLGFDAAAGALSAAGSGAAVLTAASGLADWRDTYGRDRRLGALHGLLNTVGLGLQLGSLLARRRRHPAARRLGIAGWLVSMGAAYLGGELVFGRGVMVNHTAWKSGPEEWTAVLPAAELAEGSTRRAKVEERSVLLYREGGTVYALEDACSHAGGPLSEGEVEDGVVTCPWHGSRFRIKDGSILRGPATFPQPRLQTRVRDGMIEVRAA